MASHGPAVIAKADTRREMEGVTRLLCWCHQTPQTRHNVHAEFLMGFYALTTKTVPQGQMRLTSVSLSTSLIKYVSNQWKRRKL